MPCGLGARDTLRLEVCYPLHGNDITPGDGRDRGRARLGVRARHGVHRAPTSLRRVKEDGPARRLVAVRDGGAGDPAPGHGDRGRRRGHVGHALAHRSTSASAWATCRADWPSPDTELVIDVRGKAAARPGREEADLPEGDASGRSESYPDDLRYHPEHDWARVEGDEATLGITWYAQDALGELVLYEPPEVGATVTKDESYGEVESVKAVSDVIAPLSGEVLEVNRRRSTSPRPSTTTRTARAGSSGSGCPIPARLDALLDAEAYRAQPLSRAPQREAPDACRLPSRCTRRRPRREMLAAIGVASVDELFEQIPPGVRLGRAARPARRRCREASSSGTSRSSPRATRTPARELSLPRRGHLRPLRPGGRRRVPLARRVPHRVHAVPARDEPGHRCRRSSSTRPRSAS